MVGTGCFEAKPNLVRNKSNVGVFFKFSTIFLAEGLNIQEILDDIKKLKATVKKQGRRIAHLESICGIESTKSKRDGENV